MTSLFIKKIVDCACHLMSTLVARPKKCHHMIPIALATNNVEVVDTIPAFADIIGTLTQTTMIFRILVMKIGQDIIQCD